MSRIVKQFRAAFPPKPDFTESHVGNLTGKVYIVTGSNTGVGFELAKILYGAGGTVYVAGRSDEKCKAAVGAIEAAHPASAGRAAFLRLDLADLRAVKAAAAEFLAAEARLDVLFNNAGVMMPPTDRKTAQGLDLQLGTNCVGHFLLTKLLTPVLAATAASPSAKAGSVRVVWVSSSTAELMSPRPGGLDVENLDYKKKNERTEVRYGISKAGNYLHAVEFASRLRRQGVVSVPLNPGNLETELTRHLGSVVTKVLNRTLHHPPVYGAYTELWAGLSPEVGLEQSGQWVAPWGRFETIRDDIAQATKHVEEGGTGIGLKFWEWTEEQVKPYL
ncbi:hypothetical protein GGTG_09777 [Gaeumannomyces tritici R3-111a-1]|uniref:Short-chain dehydrogenase n=1 Tax=Gaeumannomyces tritici (strain R3-111a-1) TaxID=644352 RepID=J3P8E3_GAET3|nr:hypothetical protein GGTG_09777 [Gaeumannomyces tritici R3-111a-1]EJT72926.1 hypothetical protein GGTG_09777 [Gaeumannomyces tritici R3-111a-1]